MSQKSFSNANTQTVIKLDPHVLEVGQLPKVTSDCSLGKVLSITPKHEQHFYSLLRYTPFSDIKENSIRIIDIPRIKKLQFHSIEESEEMKNKARQFSLADDDGVGYICSALIKRNLRSSKTAYFDSESQTDVFVVPHVLDENNVALVYHSKDTQTSI